MHFPYRLELGPMRRAAALLEGKHDFAAFCASGAQTGTTVRTVKSVEITGQPGGMIYFTVTGEGFLYNMVRIIAGTLLRGQRAHGAGAGEPRSDFGQAHRCRLYRRTAGTYSYGGILLMTENRQMLPSCSCRAITAPSRFAARLPGSWAWKRSCCLI